MLLRLVAYGLVGYAAYELYRIATSAEGALAGASDSGGQASGGTSSGGNASGRAGGQSPARRADGNRNRIGREATRSKPTGEVLSSTPMPTGGMEVTTGDPDGGAIRHKVGRGVIPAT